MAENRENNDATELDDAKLGKVSGGYDGQGESLSIEGYQAFPRRIGRSAPCPLCGLSSSSPHYSGDHPIEMTEFGEMTYCMSMRNYYVQV